VQKNRTASAVIKRVGANVRKARRALRLSQEALAFDAKVDRTLVSKIERGCVNATIGTLVKLSIALHLDVRELLS
jgi:transcriptional regulator with XRE-family HTH domain